MESQAGAGHDGDVQGQGLHPAEWVQGPQDGAGYGGGAMESQAGAGHSDDIQDQGLCMYSRECRGHKLVQAIVVMPWSLKLANMMMFRARDSVQ